MVIRNWRDVKPGIAHEVGIDYQLLKGQSLKQEGNPFAQMEGFMYIAFAMLQPGQAYHAHSHDDHEEIYYITKGKGEMVIDGETQPIRDGDAIYIGKNQVHSIVNNTKDEFIEFLAFAAMC